jgi:hypothetical protein
MLVGAVVDVLAMASTALGMGSHPALGFDVAPVDAAYGLTGGEQGVLAEVCVGHARTGLGLEGGVVTW